MLKRRVHRTQLSRKMNNPPPHKKKKKNLKAAHKGHGVERENHLCWLVGGALIEMEDGLKADDGTAILGVGVRHDGVGSLFPNN